MTVLTFLKSINILNPKCAIVLIGVWMFVVFISMIGVGFVNSEFFHFGPSPNVRFFSNTIDTWGKWCAVVVYTVINQLIQTYGLETITPWMINNIQNVHITVLKDSPAAVQGIVGVWYIYLWSGRIFGIQILTSQIDFLFVVLFADLFATFVTTRWYIKRKQNANAYTTLTSPPSEA